MVRPSWSAEYKFAACDVRARWRAPLGIVAALTKNAQGHDTPIVPIKQAWRCAHDRQGQVAALPPSAALDDRYAQRPCEIRAGPRSRKPVKQGDALAKTALTPIAPYKSKGGKLTFMGRLGKDRSLRQSRRSRARSTPHRPFLSFGHDEQPYSSLRLARPEKRVEHPSGQGVIGTCERYS